MYRMVQSIAGRMAERRGAQAPTHLVPAALVPAALVLAGLLATPATLAAETVRVGGTGMALEAMRRMGAAFTAEDRSVTVEVLPSMGTPGGLRALKDGVIDLAIIGRSMSAQEREGGFKEAFCLVTPLVFATSRPRPPGIARQQLPALYGEPRAAWADGATMRIILRARTGSELPYLASVVPGLGDAFERAAKRSDVPVGSTDQENADLAHRIDGSLAVMTLLQINSERLDLRTVEIDGVAPSPDALARDVYPFSMRACLVIAARSGDAAARLVALARSERGTALIRNLGGEPSE